MNKKLLYFSLLVLGGLPAGHAAADDDFLELGNRRELFVDHTLIAALNGATLRLHEPVREGVALQFDRPYEGRYSAYATVLNDRGKFRMYYRGLPSPGADIKAVTCYAESIDGVHWTKPDLGLYEYEGSTTNNIVFGEKNVYSRNFSPFIDNRPGVPESERFKAIAGVETKGLVAFVSGDGLNWRRWGPEYIFTDGMFDSHNVVFWSDHEQAYVCYFRTWTGEGFEGYRTISRTTSPDLLNWSPPVRARFGDTPMEHLYTNGMQPYFRAPHIYIGLAKRFFPEKAAFSLAKGQSFHRDPNRGDSSSDAVLLSSRGGDLIDRTFMEGFIRPGPTPRDWAARDNTPALGIVPSGERDMYIYRMSHYGQVTAHLSLHRLRTDGFVSINAPYEGGEVVTKPFTFSGDELVINYGTSAAGSVRVEILDAEGNVVPGFSAEECELIFGDEIDRPVRWGADADLADLNGVPVRLRIEMSDADLYSFQFR
ncbi:MAG: hypothetical protein SynsKO_32150 [Synoicihabitans sp.]